MPRQARLKIEKDEAWYHLYNRINARKDEYPLAECQGAQDKFIELMNFYARAFFCDIGGYSVMGNHYHIVVRFEAPRRVAKKELLERAMLIYPNSEDVLIGWSDERWSRFKERLFDVSELMRNIHQAFAKWFNYATQRRGRVWAERFKSTILQDEKAIIDCLTYVDLNPVRAKLVKKPEDYKYGSYHLRDMVKDVSLLDMRTIMGIESLAEARREYRRGLYYKGNIVTKENQDWIDDEVLREEERHGFASRGLFCKRVRHFTRGLVLAKDQHIATWLDRLKGQGLYRRRVNPAGLAQCLYSAIR